MDTNNYNDMMLGTRRLCCFFLLLLLILLLHACIWPSDFLLCRKKLNLPILVIIKIIA
uniref:Uncharacterized protein n=1 Tax=Arundo donax TaxID=35708 RepID=A0A0A9BQC8_ARUDO